MKITISVVARILTNVEALNMAETVGNVSRHRRAPIVVYSDRGYKIVYVPAVSGESLAYHYQSLLTKIAIDRNLPTTEMDRRGYYMKYSDDNIIKNYYKEVSDVCTLNDACEIEKKTCRGKHYS